MVDVGEYGTLFNSPEGGSFGIPALSAKAVATFGGVRYTGSCKAVNF